MNPELTLTGTLTREPHHITTSKVPVSYCTLEQNGTLYQLVAFRELAAVLASFNKDAQVQVHARARWNDRENRNDYVIAEVNDVGGCDDADLEWNELERTIQRLLREEDELIAGAENWPRREADSFQAQRWRMLHDQIGELIARQQAIRPEPQEAWQ